MNLFEIDAMITDCVDLETGMIIDMEMLQALEMERSKKIKNIALWIKNLKAEAEALKAQKDAFAARQKAAENKVESLKQYLTLALDGKPVKDVEFAISFRKTTGTNITDVSAIPQAFLIEQEPKIDKAGILKALKDGAVVPGAELKEGMAMTLK